MNSYTFISKKVHCPLLNDKITLCGKYYFVGDIKDGRLSFATASCPVVENSMLPIYEQREEYKYMICGDHNNCKLLKEFPEEIKYSDYSL